MMNGSNAGFRSLIIGCGLAFAVACSPIVRNYGYVPTDSELAAVTVGFDTRDTITANFGPATTTGTIGDSAFYYVQSRFETLGPGAPVEKDRQVVAISFSNAGTVSNIERFTLQDGNVVTLSRRVTEDSVANNTFLRQLLGSVGRFNAEDLISE
ncbi:outer membrane protein assembly factor BamE [Loktanella sp. R86503]|uniref:outer membrane protein assembly factor BamE n=1 Tax=Loktanella sp. R86503 TaxID=3093847 RepID=UPI0036DA4388